MTPEQRKTLLNLIIEYGNSLTRIQGEKELMKMIEARAVCECDTDAKAFKLYATAHWRDRIPATQAEIESQLEIFETVRGLQQTA